MYKYTFSEEADNWRDGYPNVMMNVTCEDQELPDKRLPYLLDLPARHRAFIFTPMLGPIDASTYLATGKIEHFSAAGELYGGSRPLDFDWIRSLVRQSETYRVNFQFGEIGNHFIKDGVTIHSRFYCTPNSQRFSLAFGILFAIGDYTNISSTV